MNISPTKTPDRITPAIVKGCTQLVPSGIPIFVERAQEHDALINKCVFNVKNYLLSNPGEMVLGWEIAIWENVLLDCIGHAVVRVDGKLKCITPSKYGDTKLLFLPDPSLTFDFSEKMSRMPTTQVAISTRPEVKRLIEIESLERSIKVKYPVSTQEIIIGGQDAYELQRLAKEKQWTILMVILATSDHTTKCLCGSGKKFRKCHRSAMESMLVER
ncbi:SEC-C domain-containing protein [Hydrogenophaga sp. D2P1]|uniref:SEC-C domain-containing protein n=1 Tax=Hydrogenophaga aromaticivorans TaxID=2610898 RepID=A0A7Y8KYM5_9BURK|nr:SEC-C domain-containing protein [Hydrogenophaga aromaticivorans]NWF47189.1 SEC-C domain-containing protein [Hydrogenophaga aromaticivorans]